MHHHRPVKLVRKPSLIRGTKVVAVLKGMFEVPVFVRLVEHGHGLVVAQPRKRRLHCGQLGHVAPNHLQFRRAVFEHALHNVAEEVLRQLQQPIEIAVRNLRLDHPELGQMPPRLRLLRPERWPETVHLAQRQCRGLDIELAALR